MDRHYHKMWAMVVTLAIVSGACSELPTDGDPLISEKRRGENLSGIDCSRVTAQDLDILLPREPLEGLKGDTPTRSGDVLLEPRWVDIVSEAFGDTAVEDALELDLGANTLAEDELGILLTVGM